MSKPKRISKVSEGMLLQRKKKKTTKSEEFQDMGQDGGQNNATDSPRKVTFGGQRHVLTLRHPSWRGLRENSATHHFDRNSTSSCMLGHFAREISKLKKKP